MGRVSPLAQWGVLLVASLLLGLVLQWLHVPAAFLLGPMMVGVAVGLKGATIRMPPAYFWAANAILGCLVAQSLSLSILSPLLQEWPLVLGILVATLAASGFSGWLLVKFSALPGTTGAWGASPGGASAMVAMSSEFGADVRLVAFMQYLRVLLGRWLRLPSGALLGPMILGAALHSTGTLTLQTPEWILSLAYAFIGWSVGLSFTRPIFLLAIRTLPQMMASIVGLMVLCGWMAYEVTLLLSVDILTAYLATSLGGLDSIAVIAAGSNVDMAFVIAMQTLRLFSTLLFSPVLSRHISRHTALNAT
ncbi:MULTISPECIES: AbrB family transcriptional regulator [Symbiopectobacterium]|uniref:AbrB family transcriptional regulator n=1 Tax=Symbiopectobacterium TaxID=801 RepID=UPI001A342FEC|nr:MULTISPECIES: AbrB family transcriptional regulator [Symbiopectobacterium]MBG6249191.1 AbrB family transcriptional regulator [Candidatus Symbiopectobacterium sp. PLON1]MBT9430477.1 AbrB family transcriptional regulator [Candidatus Symbiopectobacterium endolongispinus]